MNNSEKLSNAQIIEMVKDIVVAIVPGSTIEPRKECFDELTAFMQFVYDKLVELNNIT